jgi:hypothetical protein
MGLAVVADPSSRFPTGMEERKASATAKAFPAEDAFARAMKALLTSLLLYLVYQVGHSNYAKRFWRGGLLFVWT